MNVKPERERRYAYFAVSPELLLQALFSPSNEGERVSVDGLPDGIEATDIVFDFERRAFLIRVWHESFAVIPEANRIPEVFPRVTVTRTEKTSRMREFL